MKNGNRNKLKYALIYFVLIWGLGIGDWGLGIGQSPIPNPQSPVFL